MAVMIQQPLTPEERFWEQTQWMDAEQKDRWMAFWTAEDALLADNNLPGLLRLREARWSEDPKDLFALQELAEAVLMGGDGRRAIDLLAEAHRENPEHEGVQRLILEGLFLEGKRETDFPWLQRIPVLRLGPKVVDWSLEIVTDAGGVMLVGELYEAMSYRGFLAFKAEQLARFLRRQEHFAVQGAQRHMWRLWVELPILHLSPSLEPAC